MAEKKIIEIVSKFASKVKEKYDCVSVILFGSYAKGSFNENSDIDIAVVLKDYENFFNIQVELMRLRRDIDTRIEPHPIKEKDFNENTPLINEIKKYGQVINVA
jgi:predicted nucleotidyltransferase